MKMKSVGITGGIGSGKSKVMQHLASLGYPIYLSDEASKRIMDTEDIIRKIQNLFDVSIITNGKLDRKKIATIVFTDKEKLNQLNDIVHPAVAQDYKVFLEENKGSDIVFYESAILIESNNYKKFDFIVLITAPEDIRIKRVMKRDQISEEMVRERMKNQMKDEEKLPFVDHVIENVEFEKTIEKLEKLINILKK